MDFHKLKELTPEERHFVLESESSKSEEISYLKPLTDEEITEQRAILSTASIDRSVIEEEFNEVKKDYKARLEPIKAEISAAIIAIKQRGEWVKGKVYHVPDFDAKTITIVNPGGHVVETRPMKPEERQFLISHNKSA